jgi:hypothetical protein
MVEGPVECERSVMVKHRAFIYFWGPEVPLGQ